MKLPQQRSKQLGLFKPFGRVRDATRRIDELGQQHLG